MTSVNTSDVVLNGFVYSLLHPAQMPRWPSSFAPWIKIKLKDFSGEFCYFGQHPKRKGSVSPSKFDGQLSNILFTYFYLCVRVLRVVGLLQRPNPNMQEKYHISYFDGAMGGDYF